MVWQVSKAFRLIKSSVLKKQPALIKPASLEAPYSNLKYLKTKKIEIVLCIIIDTIKYTSIKILVYVFKALENNFWKQMRDINIISPTNDERKFIQIHSLACMLHFFLQQGYSVSIFLI